jgi:uncharacterized protein YkwD
MNRASFKGLAPALAGLLFLISPTHRAFADMLDSSLLEEVNFARAHPSDYAQVLLREAEADRFNASSFAGEDPHALDEAVTFLRRQEALPPLQPDAKLAAAALAHAAAQGREGGFGHVSPDGETLSQRLHDQGIWASLAGEDISYGYRTPRDAVRQLIIDSGVPDRGHRKTLFGPAYHAAGVSCGSHRVYGAMCVIDFASAIVPR